MALTVLRDTLKSALAQVADLTTHKVMVGIPDAKAERTAEPDEKRPASNALIGYVMENGLPERNIPARPHLVPGVKDAQERTTKYLEQAARAALDGNADKMMQALNAAGLAAQASVRAKITDGPFVALAEATLAERKRAGFKGTKPLIRSGQYRNAISYVVRKK